MGEQKEKVILTSEEKDYLTNWIKPIRKRVKFIFKDRHWEPDKNKYYHYIGVYYLLEKNDTECEQMYSFKFPAKTKFRHMKLNEWYKIEDFDI